MQVYRANHGFLKQNPLDSSFAMEHAIAFAENPIAGVPYKWRTCCALTDVCDEPCRTCWDDAQSMLVVVMLCHMRKVVVVVRMRGSRRWSGDGVGGRRAGGHGVSESHLPGNMSTPTSVTVHRRRRRLESSQTCATPIFIRKISLHSNLPNLLCLTAPPTASSSPPDKRRATSTAAVPSSRRPHDYLRNSWPTRPTMNVKKNFPPLQLFSPS